MENRTGLIVDAELTQATGWPERGAGVALVETALPVGGVMLGAGKGYGTKARAANLRALGVTRHMAQDQQKRRSAIDGRTTRHPCYGIS